MGDIKDVIDLITQLSNRVQDRKIAEELNSIQSLILGIQSEQAGLHERNIKLREEGLSLKEHNQVLERQIKKLTSTSTHAQSDEPICPNCSTDSKPFFLSPMINDMAIVTGLTHNCTKCGLNMNNNK